MNIKLLYFASIREAMGRDSEEVDLPGSVNSVGELISHLARQDSKFAALANNDNALLVAVNQMVAKPGHALAANDEVAFFPPMTGG